MQGGGEEGGRGGAQEAIQASLRRFVGEFLCLTAALVCFLVENTEHFPHTSEERPSARFCVSCTHDKVAFALPGILPSVSLFLLSLCLSISLTRTHTHTHTPPHTLSLSLSHASLSVRRIAGIHITAVTVGKRASFEIRGIASDPDWANVILAENFQDLPNVQPNLVSAMCDGE